MRTVPKRLGLLGGIMWHSSVIYERLINEAIGQALPGETADLVIRSYNFGDIARAQTTNDWVGLATQFGKDAQWLRDGGAEAIVICANTMHIVADEVEQAAGIPVINMIDATAASIKKSGLDTVALLGTAFTMRMPFYRERMATHGITTIAPEEPDLADLHALLYGDVARGVITDGGRELAHSIAQRVLDRGASGVIAGCTEIPLILTADDVPVPYFDAMAIHAEAAAAFALAD